MKLGYSVWASPVLICVPLLSPVVFNMNFVDGEEHENKIPIALGLKDQNMYLSCAMQGGKPTLQLEVSI